MGKFYEIDNRVSEKQWAAVKDLQHLQKVGPNNENKICGGGYIKEEGGVKGLPRFSGI